jgi:hypothetical protein
VHGGGRPGAAARAPAVERPGPGLSAGVTAAARWPAVLRARPIPKMRLINMGSRRLVIRVDTALRRETVHRASVERAGSWDAAESHGA